MATYSPGSSVPDTADVVFCPAAPIYQPLPNVLDCYPALVATQYGWSCADGSCTLGGDLAGYGAYYSGDTPLPPPSGFAGSSGGGGSTVVTFGEPFNLSAADGVLVGGAIATLWVIAYAWRALRSALGTGGYGGAADE